jgi:PAS domain S-box-containing protein
VEDLASDKHERALAKLESLLATAPVGIGFLDRDLRYMRINDALASINGLPARDHIGRSIAEMLPDIAPYLEPLLRGLLATGEPLRDLELDTGVRSFLANYFPVRSLQGRIIGVGGMVIEITERRRIEDELRRAVRTREDVLAVVSHDLRSPLSTIELTATMLGMQLGTDPAVRNHVAVIHRSAARMRHMIDDLIDSASIAEGRLSLQMAPESVDALMTEALDLQQAIALERGISIERIHETAGAIVSCDRMRILQVFGNLIGNSIKFGRAGGQIVVAARHVGDAVEFSVRDDGPGINADVLPALFDPYRVPPSQEHAGSGLGLHISKGIIERHGGKIWATTELGSGTTMFFTLPIT